MENSEIHAENIQDVDLLTRKLGVIEALLFAADEPLDEGDIASVSQEILEPEVQELIEKLEEKYLQGNHGIRVERVAGGWRLTTRSEYSEAVKKHLRGKIRTRLSRASLEAVSIIAYRQPISRAEIEEIRGVDPAHLLRNLLDRGLIRVTGRAEAPGRPLLYGTTDSFLAYFGLDSLNSLPQPEELLDEFEGSPGVEVKNGPFIPENSDEPGIIAEEETEETNSKENEEQV